MKIWDGNNFVDDDCPLPVCGPGGHRRGLTGWQPATTAAAPVVVAVDTDSMGHLQPIRTGQPGAARHYDYGRQRGDYNVTEEFSTLVPRKAVRDVR